MPLANLKSERVIANKTRGGGANSRKQLKALIFSIAKSII